MIVKESVSKLGESVDKISSTTKGALILFSLILGVGGPSLALGMTISSISDLPETVAEMKTTQDALSETMKQFTSLPPVVESLVNSHERLSKSIQDLALQLCIYRCEYEGVSAQNCVPEVADIGNGTVLKN